MSNRVDGESSRHTRQPERVRLDSWKEVAAYFGRDERTVKRWEKNRSLPIHRIPGHQRSSVFAYTDELTNWLNSTPREIESPDISITDASTATPSVVIPQIPEAALISNPEAAIEEAKVSEAVVPAIQLPASSGTRHWAVLVGACLVLLLATGAYAIHRFHVAEAAKAASVASAHTSIKTDPRAVEFYLKGRYYWNLRTAESLNRAVDAFTQAIVVDPSYAEAYAGLADSYNLLRQYSAMPESEAYPRAIAAASKAVALNGSLAEAHRALAFPLFYWNWKVPEALDEYKKAIQLDPNSADAHHWYATSLMTLGRLNEALAEIERARALSPASRSILADRALILYGNGDHAAGIAALKELEQSEPNFLSPPRYLANLYFDNGDYADYLIEAQRAAQLSKNPEHLALASAAKQAWEKGGAHKMLEAMAVIQQKSLDNGHASGFHLADTYLHLGRRQEAIHSLQAAFAAHDANIFSLRQGQFVDHLKGDPGFDKLREKVLLYLSRKAGQPLPA